MKIIFFQSPDITWDKKAEQLCREFPEVKCVFHKDITDNDIREAECFVGVPRKNQIEKADNLKIIFLNFTGPDMLPLDIMLERKIRLSNTHGNARFVAERALTLATAFYGRVVEVDNDLRNGIWHGIWGGSGNKDTWESLFEKKCAILGTGEIGKWIARYLRLFNCEITGFKKRSVSGQHEYFDKITLDLTKAISENEIIFVTLPFTAETRGIINANILSKMNGKFIVNVGRGGVIDEKGLYNSLKNRILKGAAIDVWFSYPEWGKRGQPSNYPFHELENILLSPHVGGSVSNALKINLNQTFDNIREYIKTGNPVYEVNISSQY